MEIARRPQPASIPAEMPQSQKIPPISTADEILKFKQLFDIGAITQEEFEAKKKQLLEL
jgi:hypothetical protein